MELSQPFVRLPFQFDAEQLSRELAALSADAWMEHPSKIVGNLAIPLISLGGDNNNDFAGRMKPTNHLDQCFYMRQVMATFDEVLARSRLMRLNAGAEVSPHVDFNYHWYSRVRIHIPIVTNPDVTFYCGDQSIHMQAGECWIFDSWRRHNVINSGNEDRVHLVVDTAGSSQFWNMVKEMEVFGTDQESPELQQKIRHVPYQKDKSVEIRTERYNVSPVMTPGELNAIVKELIVDFTNNAENNPTTVDKFSTILMGLSHDWRETWHLFGHEEAGWPRYRELLQKTFNALGDNPRELVTASNSVGVKPIVVQRILRAALNTEQFELFNN